MSVTLCTIYKYLFNSVLSDVSIDVGRCISGFSDRTVRGRRRLWLVQASSGLQCAENRY